MLALSTPWFQQTLEHFPGTKQYWIAFSGGLDSRVLLDLCARLQAANTDYRFTAIHINHQLQAESAQWAQFCTETCQQLNIDCIVKSVNARPGKGISPEQAARDARRSAFSQIMSAGDMLLTAHHLNDQAETVLLRLFRGSGITGLAGIRPHVEFSVGWMARPLLTVSQGQLQDYAQQHLLEWVQDPSNQNHDFDRNFLRHAIIPQLEQRWPGVQGTLARNAQHCSQANTILKEHVRQALTPLLSEGGLSIPGLMAVDSALQNLLLREWFAEHQLTMPSSQMLEQIKHDVIAAKASADPAFSWQIDGRSIQVRRYRNQLFIVKKLSAVDPGLIIHWDGKSQLELPAGLGYLQTLHSEMGGIDQTRWNQSQKTIRFRSGGERCKLPGRAGHRSLKAIFQEYWIPPWERDRIPLVYLDDELAAIGTLLVCEPFFVDSGQSIEIIYHHAD